MTRRTPRSTRTDTLFPFTTLFRSVLLQHHPLHPDVVLRVAPVAKGIEVAHEQAALQALRDVREPARDLSGHEGFASARAFVIKQDAVAGVHPVEIGRASCRERVCQYV